MRTIDRLLDKNSIAVLKSMVSRKLISISVDEAKLCDTQLIVQLNLDSGIFHIKNDVDVVDYYGEPEDITALSVHEGEDKRYGFTLHSFPIEKTISQIDFVNYHIRTSSPGIEKSNYIYSFTKGIIMTFSDKTQMLFERLDNFIEMIVITQGNNLMNKLESIYEYCAEGHEALKTERSIEVINLAEHDKRKLILLS